MLNCLQLRSFSTSVTRMGGMKAKRRKHRQRQDNPHLPFKATAASPTKLAMAHFDELYSGLYRNKWSSIRLGLLSPGKHCALVNNFGDTEDTIARLKDLDCIDIGQEFTAARERIMPYIAQSEEDKSYEQDSPTMRHEMNEEDLEDVVKKPIISSLNPDLAKSRLIHPDERVLGASGGASALHDFVPTSELKGMEEFVEESEYYDLYTKVEGDKSVRIRPDPIIEFPKHLKLFTFPRGDISRFPPPRPGMLNTNNYYCMDAASILPVLALDIKPGQVVLDMCAGPGGKSLLMLQTLYPSLLHCNDINHTRLGRLISVLDQFVGPGPGVGGIRDTVSLTKRDGTQLLDREAYDRVLVDAPCFSDRHSLASEEGNVFVKNQIKERLKMPEKQTNLLKNGLLLVKPGGCLVYSTCTLSPIQNDGVVQMALRSLWEDTDLDFEVCDMTEAVKPFRFLAKFHHGEGLKYGQLILPFLPNNFGPIYFCKIRRVK